MGKFLKAVGVIALILVIAVGYIGFRAYKQESERTQKVADTSRQMEDALQALEAATSAIPSATPRATASTAPSEAPAPTAAEPEAQTEAAESGIRPEFQEAMDSYEAFFDEYIAFMKSYQESANPASMMKDYLDYMTQYAETMDKLSKLGEEELSEQEALYYAEVSLRINQKLLEVAG